MKKCSEKYIIFDNIKNYRLIYNENEIENAKEIIGIENWVIQEKDFVFGIVKFNGTDFQMSRNKELNDSIQCNGQIIIIPEITCNAVNILGLSYWQEQMEESELEFSDGTKDYAHTYFYDMGTPPDANWVRKYMFDEKKHEYDKRCSVVTKYHSPIHQRDMHLCLCRTELTIKNRILKKIILPENFFINIFAITVCE